MKFERDRAIAAIRKNATAEKDKGPEKTPALRVLPASLLACWPAYGHVAETIFTALSRM